jgi:thymidylate synthase (FAD)
MKLRHDITVHYRDHMGDDNLVVDAFRASFAKMSANYTTEQNVSLLQRNILDSHTSPARHPQLSVFIEAPIFVMRQAMRHNIGGTHNEASMRYIVPDELEFYVPEVWRRKGETRRDGSGEDFSHDTSRFFERHVAHDVYARIENVYDFLIHEGVAPELARIILPVSTYTRVLTTGSLLYWANFCKQRLDRHAQFEVQQLAMKIYVLCDDHWPVSWRALSKLMQF